MKVSFNKHTDSENKDGIKIPYAPAKRTFPRLKWYLVLLLVFSPFAYMLFQMGYPFFFARSSGVISMQKFPITALETGVITGVLVKGGDFVDKGGDMFTFEAADFQTRRERLIILMAERDAIMSDLEHDGGGASDSAELQTLRQNAKKQADNLHNIKNLFQQGAATRAELNAAEQAHKSAQTTLNGVLNSLKSTPSADSDRNRDMARINAEIEVLSESLSVVIIESPTSGDVLEVFVTPGITVVQGSVLSVVGKPEEAEIVAVVDLADFGIVTPGRDAAVVFADGTSIRARVLPAPSYENLKVEEPPLAGEKKVISVKLQPLGKISDDKLVDGLPVQIDWGFKFQWWE